MGGQKDDPPRDPEKTVRLCEPLLASDEVLRIKAQARPCLVVIAGEDLGARRRIHGEFLIGRDPGAAFCLSDRGVSWHHARVEDRGDGWAFIDLGSTNGSRVNGKRCSEHILTTGDKLQMGSTLLRFELRDPTEQAYDELMDQMIHMDDLTGLYQRRRFDKELSVVLRSAATEGAEVGMLVMDLDGIKDINDTHGHLFGAFTIAEAGKVIGRVLKDRGIAARFGGDEFVAAVPKAGLEQTVRIGEAILEAIGAHQFKKSGIVLRPGISIGVAAYSRGEPAKVLFERADAALYRAKTDGKNCVRT